MTFQAILAATRPIVDGDRLSYDSDGKLRHALPGEPAAFVFNSTFMRIEGANLVSDRGYFESWLA